MWHDFPNDKFSLNRPHWAISVAISVCVSYVCMSFWAIGCSFFQGPSGFGLGTSLGTPVTTLPPRLFQIMSHYSYPSHIENSHNTSSLEVYFAEHNSMVQPYAFVRPLFTWFIQWKRLISTKNKLQQSWRMMLHKNVEKFQVKIFIHVFQNPLSLMAYAFMLDPLIFNSCALCLMPNP